MIRYTAWAGAALLTLAAGGAWAEAGAGGVYIGASAGYTQLDDFDEDSLGVPGINDSSVDDSSDGTEIFAGVRFGQSIPILRHFAIEVGYMDLGNFSIDANTDPGDPGGIDLGALGITDADGLIGGLLGGLLGGGGTDPAFTPDNYRAELDITGWQYGVLGFIPVTDRLEVFGRGGIFDWKAKASVVASDRVGSGTFERDQGTEKGNDAFFGGGVNWKADDHWSVRAEWRRMQTEDDDVDFISAGGAFHF